MTGRLRPAGTPLPLPSPVPSSSRDSQSRLPRPKPAAWGYLLLTETSQPLWAAGFNLWMHSLLPECFYGSQIWHLNCRRIHTMVASPCTILWHAAHSPHHGSTIKELSHCVQCLAFLNWRKSSRISCTTLDTCECCNHLYMFQLGSKMPRTPTIPQ